VNGSTTTIRRSSNPEFRGFRNFMGMSMVMSLAVVFFGMQLMMVGPLKGRLETIQTRMESTENNMNKLVAVRDSVFRTNDLLSSLEDQSSRLQSLEQSITDIKTLRTAIEQEAGAAQTALASIDKLSAVQQRIIETEAQTQKASAQFNAMHELQMAILKALKLPTTHWKAWLLCRIV
jgi:prophage DNA circulation protein